MEGRGEEERRETDFGEGTVDGRARDGTEEGAITGRQNRKGEGFLSRPRSRGETGVESQTVYHPGLVEAVVRVRRRIRPTLSLRTLADSPSGPRVTLVG